MSTVHDQFVGTADEVSYGTAVAPNNFFEILSESVNGAYERIESEGIRGAILRADRFAPNPKGAAGDLEFEVLDKAQTSLGFWLKHMFGDVTVTGDGTTTAFEYTAVPGDTRTKSFTYQAARYAAEANELIPFSYSGGKVTEWELSAEVDGILKCKVSMDFASETIAGAGAHALATPTYPTGAQLLTFIGAEVTVGGVTLPISQFALSGSNGLKTDRYLMRGAASTSKREPREESMKEFALSLTAEFENDDQIARVASATAAGALAEVVLNFDSPQGGALVVTIPAVRWDEAPTNAARELLMQEITTKVLQPADGSDAIEAVFTTVL